MANGAQDEEVVVHATHQVVVAGATVDRVVSGHAVDRIAQGGAMDAVAKGGAEDRLNVDDGLAVEAQVDADASTCAVERERVAGIAAINADQRRVVQQCLGQADVLGPGAEVEDFDRVESRATEHKGAGADQTDGVGIVAALEGVGRAGCRVGGGHTEQVVAVVALQQVVAQTAGDGVVPRARGNGVSHVTANNGVGIGTALDREAGVEFSRCIEGQRMTGGQCRAIDGDHGAVGQGVLDDDIRRCVTQHDAFDLSYMVEFIGRAIGVGVGQHVGTGTADHRVAAGQGASKADGVGAGTEVNAVVAASAGVNHIVAVAQTGNICSATKGEMIDIASADDVEFAGRFGSRIERQASTVGCVNRRVRPGARAGRVREQGVSQCQLDVGSADDNAFDIEGIVEFTTGRAGDIGIAQHVSAAVALNGVSAAQGVAKDNRVVAGTKADAVSTTKRGVDKVIAFTQADDVIATAQGDAVRRRGADDVEARQAVFCRRVKRQARTRMGVDRRRARCEQGVGDLQVDIGTVNQHAFYVGDVVEFTAVRTGDVGIGQHIGADAAQHGVTAAEIATECDRVVAGTQIDAVIAAFAGVHIVVAGAQAGNVVGRAQRDRVHRVGADDIDGFGFNTGIQRQVVARAGVHCGFGRQNGTVAQRDGDVGARNRHVFDVACAVERTGEAHIGVGQGVGAATEHHVGTRQRTSKVDPVVAAHQDDAVVAAMGGVNHIIANDGVIATSQRDMVSTRDSGTQNDHAVAVSRCIEHQRCRRLRGVQRRTGREHIVAVERDLDITAHTTHHRHQLHAADMVELARRRVVVDVGQRVAAFAHQGVRAAQYGIEIRPVATRAQVDRVVATLAGVDVVTTCAQAGNVIAAAQRDLVGARCANHVDRVRVQSRHVTGIQCEAGRARGINGQLPIGAVDHCFRQRQVDIRTGHRDVFNVADMVERTGVNAVASEYQHVARAVAAIHGVGAAEVRTADDRVIATAEADEVVAAAQGDAVGRRGADDIEARQAVFCRRIQRQASACGSVNRGAARCKQAGGDRQVNVVSADQYALDVGDVVEFAATRAGDIGVSQDVGAVTTEHSVHAVERGAKADGVVVTAQVDAVVATMGGIHIIIACAQAGNVVAGTERDVVVVGCANHIERA